MSRLNIIEMYANRDDRKDLLKAVARKALVDDEVRFKRKDGMEFDCARTVTAQRDEEGNIVAFQGIMRDVTEQKRARAELEHLAHFDSLTGLLNRHAILDKLDEWLRQSNRYKGNLSIAMVDIDHFKRVNDLHGHLVGDRVLSDTADALRRSVRLTDFVGRYGGEEFLLILPQTGAAGAMAVAERTRRLVMRTPMVDAEGGAISVTVSLGVAEWCHGDDADVLIGRADAALYRAKAAGRNRVEVEAPPQTMQ
jgi:diguanylate cyclase (GGDEF)-like protein